MQSRANSTQLRVKASGDVAERVCNYLRRRHPRKTADEVSAETGLSQTTVSAWLDRSTVPGGLAMLALIGAYGPDFLTAVMKSPPKWLDQAYREARRAELEAQSERIAREIAELGQS